MADITLNTFLAELQSQRGLDLHGYKHRSLERRIRKRMNFVGATDLSGYLQHIINEPAEAGNLLSTVLINVTEFFRDPQAWVFLCDEVLPRHLERLKPGDTFRCWSAGCASGEEVYSLAIAIAEVLGPRLQNLHIRIYGTDIDSFALEHARRGEFSGDKLRNVRPEWRERYFTERDLFRVSPEIRRMVVFGRSDVISNAPISHCQLILCRNLLIYLNTETQKSVLRKLHYALEEGGVLFRGKAESNVGDTQFFRPIHPKWRIFQKQGETTLPVRDAPGMTTNGEKVEGEDGKQQDYRRLTLQQRYLMETLRSGVLVLDANDVITAANAAVMSIWGCTPEQLVKRRIQSTSIVQMCPDLPRHLDALRANSESARFQCRMPAVPDDRVITVVLRAIISDEGERTGTLLYAEDVTHQHRLQGAVRQLETTSEELQSTNEELETTNEELQSTNEELETTNEELQSTNEELETTNEELQSVNEELENINEELAARTDDLNLLTARYMETLKRMPWPVIVIDLNERVDVWNPPAQRLFGIAENAVGGIRLTQLPSTVELVNSMLEHARAAVADRKTHVLRNQTFLQAGVKHIYDVHFTPILQEQNNVDGVLIMFGPLTTLAEQQTQDGQRAADEQAAEERRIAGNGSSGARRERRTKSRGK